MRLEIDLGPELETKLHARARAAGKEPEAYAREALSEKLSRPESFDEILAPIRNAAQASGLSDDERDALLEEALSQVRSERRNPG